MPAVCAVEHRPGNPAFLGSTSDELIAGLPAAQVDGVAFRGWFRAHRVDDARWLDGYRDLKYPPWKTSAG